MSAVNDRNEQWREWMKAAVDGDQRAYESLLKEVSEVIRGFLRKRIRADDVVEDLVQEVLLGIHKARHTFDQNRSFGSWVFAIARYKYTDYLRSRERKLKRESEDAEIDHHADQKSLEEDEMLELLREAILGLKPKQKEIVEKLKLEGRSIKEVAKEMGMSESAVKVTAHRAYKSLKDSIEKKHKNQP